MNRPPQPADWWWRSHKMSCGGTYTKISGPDSNCEKDQPREDRKAGVGVRPCVSISSYFKRLGAGRRLGGDGLAEMTERPSADKKKAQDIIDLTLD
jgi:hypothetical protein